MQKSDSIPLDPENITCENVSQIMDLVQRSSACHLKYSVILKKAVEKEENNKLLKKFCQCLQYAFTSSYKEKNVYLEKIINFTALFASSYKLPDKDGDVVIHPTLNYIFKFILKLSCSANECHRYWSCFLFNRIFQELEELSDELYEEVKESMMEKLRDTKADIRCQAIIALHRIQDPTDKNDSVIRQFGQLLNSDFNAKVRRLCLEKIAINKYVLPDIIKRITDIDENVRLAVFKKLQPISKYLIVSQKRLILQCGFLDSSEKVKKFTCTDLLEAWLESYDNNYLNLMKSIRFDACEEDIIKTTRLVELMLEALFKNTTVDNIISYLDINSQKLIDYENINWESILYYRIVIQYFRQSSDFEDSLNKILPEVVDFCKYIKGYSEFAKEHQIDELEYNFYMQQLFLIVYGYDVSDVASRQSLNSLIFNVLHREDNLSTNTIEILLHNLENTIADVDQRSLFVSEIISDIMLGEEVIDYEEIENKERERQHTISQLQSDIIILQEQENHYVLIERNLPKAEDIKQQIEEKKLQLLSARTVKWKSEELVKKSDVGTLSKCLTIAEAFLRSPSIKLVNPAIATLNSEIITQYLIHENDEIKVKALNCYALICVIDLRTAKYGIHLFSGILCSPDLENIPILVCSLKVVIDLLNIYGFALIEKNDEEEASTSRCEDEKKVFVGGTSLSDLLQALANYLEHEDIQVQKVATKGVCLLLLHSQITLASLFSRIVIKWANPVTDDSSLKQYLGYTLNSLIESPNYYLYFTDGFVTVIRTLAYAPKGSPLADIDIDNIIKFMTTVCQIPHEENSNSSKIQTDLALKICYQMSEKPRAKVNFYFSKVLLLLKVEEGVTKDELLTICDDLIDAIRDKQTVKNINKFITNLTKKEIGLTKIDE